MDAGTDLANGSCSNDTAGALMALTTSIQYGLALERLDAQSTRSAEFCANTLPHTDILTQFGDS